MDKCTKCGGLTRRVQCVEGLSIVTGRQCIICSNQVYDEALQRPKEPTSPVHKGHGSRQAENPPYPLPFRPDPDSIPQNLGRSDLWNAFEFFRIEFLLRSSKIWTLYRRAQGRTANQPPREVKNVHDWIKWQHIPRRGPLANTLWRLLNDTTSQEQFRVADGWAVITGSHIRYLKLDGIPERFETSVKKFQTREGREGIVDLSNFVNSREYKVLEQFDPEILRKELSAETKSALYLRIDRTIRPEIAIRAIKHILGQKQAPQIPKVNELVYDSNVGETTILSDPDEDPPITDLQAWLKYLLCFDLFCSGRKYRAIGSIVFGPVGSERAQDQARERAKKAVNRVRSWIEEAERGPWCLKDLEALAR